MNPDRANIFTDSNWKPYTKAMNDAKGISPNRAFYNAAERKAAIVIEKKVQSRDFALSKTALDKLLAAEAAADKVTEGFVVLKERLVGTYLSAAGLTYQGLVVSIAFPQNPIVSDGQPSAYLTRPP